MLPTDLCPVRPLATGQYGDRLSAGVPHVLQGRLLPPDLESPRVLKPDALPTSLRIPMALLTRADALVPGLASVPTVAALGQVTRSKVLLLALAHGLAVLEAKHGRRLKRRGS